MVVPCQKREITASRQPIVVWSKNNGRRNAEQPASSMLRPCHTVNISSAAQPLREHERMGRRADANAIAPANIGSETLTPNHMICYQHGRGHTFDRNGVVYPEPMCKACASLAQSQATPAHEPTDERERSAFYQKASGPRPLAKHDEQPAGDAGYIAHKAITFPSKAMPDPCWTRKLKTAIVLPRARSRSRAPPSKGMPFCPRTKPVLRSPPSAQQSQTPRPRSEREMPTCACRFQPMHQHCLHPLRARNWSSVGDCNMAAPAVLHSLPCL